MGRIIEGQVMASTHEDLRGERLEKAELEELLSGMPDRRLIYLNHDPRRPPVALASNSRLEQTEDGEWAITSDIEVLDEVAFAGVRGVSIGFNRTPVTNSAEVPRLLVSYNPLRVEGERLAEMLADFERLGEEAVLVERSEKALEVIALIWVIVSHGFWEEAGADLYRFTKSLIAPATGVESAIEIKSRPGEPEVVLLVKEDGPADATVDLPALVADAAALAPGNEVVRIVAEADESGKAVLVYAVDALGTTLRPARRD